MDATKFEESLKVKAEADESPKVRTKADESIRAEAEVSIRPETEVSIRSEADESPETEVSIRTKADESPNAEASIKAEADESIRPETEVSIKTEADESPKSFFKFKSILCVDLKKILEESPPKYVKCGGTANCFVAGKYFLKQSKSHDSTNFEHEVAVLFGLSHKNIIKTYGLLHIDKKPTAVLELCDRDLFSFMYVGSTLPIDMASSVLMQLLNGVAYLHANGIIHADLKPENILINSDGCLKIIDFGGSITVESKKFSSVTAGYMSPELVIAMREEKIPNKSNLPKLDIWAIGVILYNMTDLKFYLFEDRRNDERIINLIYFEWVEYLKANPEPDLSISLFTPIGNGHITDEYRRPQITNNIILLSALLSLYPENRPSAIEAIELLKKYPLYK